MGQKKGDYMNQERQASSRAWFCVLNNPEKQFGNIPPEEQVKQASALWMTKDTRSCGINFEKSDSGTPHMHMVLCDSNKTRFGFVQKMFPTIHIEPLLSSKKEALSYLEKTGKFEEKHHTLIVPPQYYGNIKAEQGKRSDLEVIEQMINGGYTPQQIMDVKFVYRKYEKMIRNAFFAKRIAETPVKREVKVYWHTGESGTGKSFTFVNLCKQHGEENVYMMTDYETGGLDLYCGEPYLVMDEFKGNMKFGQLLTYTDGYKIQIHCRYSNAYALWKEVHITSIFPPDEVYQFMVDTDNRDRDRVQQLLRRIDMIIYHYKEHGEYKTYSLPTTDYINYEDLKQRATSAVDSDGFMTIDDSEIPFEGA